MKYILTDMIQRKGLRLSLCALALSLTTASYAQDDMDEADDSQAATFSAPKRTAVEDKNQLITITGTVVDDVTKLPVAGVRVQCLGYNRYTSMTDANGKFTLTLPTFASALYVAAPRYATQQVGIKKNDADQNIQISLISNKFKAMYDETTNYTAKSSFKVKGGGLIVDDEIQSNLGADLRNINRSGSVDGGNAMFIRGINSINANAQPLIIVDGVEYDMQQDRQVLHQGYNFNLLANFSPEDIENVTVLKNATALYGARGANGVIIIDTKRGHSMATRIDANISAGVMLQPTTQTMMNASQYRSYVTGMLGTIPELTKTENRDVMDQLHFLNDDPNNYFYMMYHNDQDWQKEVYRTAISQNYNINVQGGDDIGMYNLSVGYMDADSPVKKTNFNRLNVRFNTDIKLLWNLSTKFDIAFSRTNNSLYEDGFAANTALSTVMSPTNLAAIKSPLVTPNQYNKHVGGFTKLLSLADDLFNPVSELLKGNEFAYSLANPTAIINNGEGDNKNKVENSFFNIHLEPTYEFNKNLKLTTLFSYTLDRNAQRYYRPAEGVPAFLVEGLGVVYNQTSSLFSKETNVLSNTHLDWTNQYGAHTLAATAGFRYNYFSYESSLATSQFKNAQDDKNPYLTANPNSAYSSIAGINDIWKNMQMYASVDWNYANRYFATLSILGEGNSRFGKNCSGLNLFDVKWAIYPSVQLGWVLTNESWFPKNIGIDYLNIHAGFDMSGNDNISNYASRTAFTSIRYNYDAIGMQMTSIGNDQINPERTTKWNAGLKTNLVNNRISLSADFFIHNTKDLLTLSSFSLPIAGINNYWTNGAALRNTGFEIALSGKPVATKDIALEMGVSVGHYHNEITELPSRQFSDGVKSFTDGTYCASVYGQNNILVQKGLSLGSFYGYQTAGVFATDAAAKAAGNNDYLKIKDVAGNETNFTAGDVHFIDQNGDGFIDEKDKVVLGNANPDIYGNIFATLNVKRFTLDLGFNYSIGNDVYNYQRSILNSGSNFYNQQVAETGYWRYEGQVTDMPKIAFGDPKGNNRFSDRWIEDGSYLRFKTARLTYQVPVPESWQSWLQGISVWGEAQNIFTITRYKGNDPEFSAGNSSLYQGVDAGMVAQSRAFVLGLKINL